jgi:hypothetical protein
VRIRRDLVLRPRDCRSARSCRLGRPLAADGDGVEHEPCRRLGQRDRRLPAQPVPARRPARRRPSCKRGTPGSRARHRRGQPGPLRLRRPRQAVPAAPRADRPARSAARTAACTVAGRNRHRPSARPARGIPGAARHQAAPARRRRPQLAPARAARHADGWNAVVSSTDQFAELNQQLDHTCTLIGRTRPLNRTAQLFIQDLDLSSIKTLVTELEQAGADAVVLVLTRDEGPARIRRLAEALLPPRTNAHERLQP